MANHESSSVHGYPSEKNVNGSILCWLQHQSGLGSTSTLPALSSVL
ncbi:hypothetical protein MtrunA17_Chr2g0298211 [Medicago truncatula]|uniref:Uncharacterized protein n=1 Tax=Medicago truncatula TaxID=3880 RepID=Q2HS14_MEDTR|nr:hypothetical protein MtrDRAFT_AC157504g33v2 [Medicago truncatula]RHN73415.1 hypothetical protein MtrunA17_Chr2g0298211 [Medicago truncatula]